MPSRLKIIFGLFLTAFVVGFGLPCFASYIDFTPVMTADNLPTPYVVSADSVHETNYGWWCFDLTGLTSWHSTFGLPHWLKLDLGIDNSQIVNVFRYRTDSTASFNPLIFKIQGSNNDTDWDDIGVFPDFPGDDMVGDTWTGYLGFPNSTNYRYYRFYITSSEGGFYSLFAEVQLLGLNEEVGYTDITPVMTSNNTPVNYVVSADVEDSVDYRAWNVFSRYSGEPVFKAWATDGSAMPHWVKIDLTEVGAEIVSAFKFLVRNNVVNYCPKDFTFQGSNNDTDWDTLKTVVAMANPGQNVWTNLMTFSNSTSYRYYRLYITANDTATNDVIIDDLRLFVSGQSVEFDIDAPTSALFDTTFDISFNATFTDVVLQLCGLWSAYDVEEFNWQSVDFTNTCNFQLDYFGLSVGSNSFLPMAMDIDGNIFYPDVFYIEGLDYEEPPAFSDPPTMTFTTNHTTTTVGTSINFYNNGYDDIHIKQLLVFDPQISEWINFDNPEPYPYDELLTIYAWTPETAGLFTFYAFVIDSDMQDAEPDPFYIDVLVSEVVEDDITLPLPVILPLLDPTNHFLIVAAEDLISFLRLDDLWNWFRTLFQQKFPFSWFYSIFEIWDEQRILISSMEEVDALKVEWVFPDTSSGFLAGQTFVLFDLQGAREHFTGFFDVIRIILINIFWLGFAGIVFFKVKKFIGELSIND